MAEHETTGAAGAIAATLDRVADAQLVEMLEEALLRVCGPCLDREDSAAAFDVASGIRRAMIGRFGRERAAELDEAAGDRARWLLIDQSTTLRDTAAWLVARDRVYPGRFPEPSADIVQESRDLLARVEAKWREQWGQAWPDDQFCRELEWEIDRLADALDTVAVETYGAYRAEVI